MLHLSLSPKRTSFVIALTLAFQSQYATADFTISNQVTTTQTLNDNETGVIEASGSLVTLGVAVNAPGNYVTVTNNGRIETSTVFNAYGVSSYGLNATIINNGSILTSERFGLAMGSGGDSATLVNAGTIGTSGDFASAIYSSGDSATLVNAGIIQTSGDNSHGVISTKRDAIITNSGSIETGGSFADGIFSIGANASITNRGSITTNNTYGAGIVAAGSDSSITNSGLISAPNSYAIGGGFNNITLNLLPGSEIIGRIDLGGAADNDTVNIYARGLSSYLTFENTENINLFGSGVVSGNDVITVDATGESTRGVILARMTSSIHGVIAQRMLYSEREPVAWAQVFGGKFNRDAEGGALGYDYDHAGINFGYEWDSDQTQYGVMGGYVSGDTDTDKASISTDSDHYYVGLYGSRKLDSVIVTSSLIAGYGNNENQRRVVDNVNGVERARSDFDSFFISPSVTLASAYTLNDAWELRPSANLGYSIAWFNGYSESGTTNANLTIDDRQSKALTARAQLAVAHLMSSRSELELRFGLKARHTDDDDTNISIAGNRFRFAAVGDDSVTGGFAGASLRIFNRDNLSLVADFEAGGNGDEKYTQGQLMLEYLF